ncbi:MAG TPA: hypothetical protein VGV34_04435, partial [Solirubrobacterales bacterium]|nr:hypothetical protein [Solirubrobacterales bacterium]
AAGDLWGSYQAALIRLYEADDQLLLDEALLGAFHERAQGLSEVFREELSVTRDDLPRLEEAVLVMAALEITVASDVFWSEWAQRRQVSVDWEGELEGGPEPAREEVAALLREARIAFGEEYGAAGAAADPSSAMIRVERGIEELVHSCAGPAGSFVRGALLAEIDTLLESLHLFEEIGELSFGTHRLRLGSGLVVTAIEKLCALVRGSLPGDLVRSLAIPGLRRALGTPLRDLNEAVVGRVVRAHEAMRRSAELLHGNEPDGARKGTLDADLSSLCLDYDRKMRTADKIAKRVRLAGPVVVMLGGIGPGRLIVAGVNGAGLAYALYSCADRLDSVPGRVTGVPGLIERALV